jgi:hypothetical protein
MTDLEDVKALKPLTQKKSKKTGKMPVKPQYLDLVNNIRVELGIPMNLSLLSRIGTDAYVNKLRKPNGEYDLKAIAAPYAKVKLEAEANKLEQKLAEKRCSIEAFKGK